MDDSLAKARKEAAEKIKESPQDFKVCESCGSIVASAAHVCPNCNAYRFDDDIQVVIEQADILAQREPLSIESQDYS